MEGSLSYLETKEGQKALLQNAQLKTIARVILNQLLVLASKEALDAHTKILIALTYWFFAYVLAERFQHLHRSF